jgi:hypothetical protein
MRVGSGITVSGGGGVKYLDFYWGGTKNRGKNNRLVVKDRIQFPLSVSGPKAGPLGARMTAICPL